MSPLRLLAFVMLMILCLFALFMFLYFPVFHAYTYGGK